MQNGLDNSFSILLINDTFKVAKNSIFAVQFKVFLVVIDGQWFIQNLSVVCP